MTSVLPLITGGAGAIVVLAIVSWLFYDGKLHSHREFRKLERENAGLRAALEAERKAVNEAARTGTVTNQLIAALIDVSAQKEGEPGRRGGGRELTGEDAGL